MSEYREITRAEISAFLRSAVILAMAKPEYINGGVRVIDASMIDGSLRLQIDNGDIVYLDFEHLVPRDTVKRLHGTPKTFAHEENECPCHVASDEDAKVCARCGVHIDSLRPPEDL